MSSVPACQHGEIRQTTMREASRIVFRTLRAQMCIRDSPLAVNAAGDPAAGLPRHGAAAANPGDRPVPVSYTHLDVYKRQRSSWVCQPVVPR